jgi:hypothetical protein
LKTYTRSAAMEGLAAESGFKVQRVGGEVLGMLHWIPNCPEAWGNFFVEIFYCRTVAVKCG